MEGLLHAGSGQVLAIGCDPSLAALLRRALKPGCALHFAGIPVHTGFTPDLILVGTAQPVPEALGRWRTTAAERGLDDVPVLLGLGPGDADVAPAWLAAGEVDDVVELPVSAAALRHRVLHHLAHGRHRAWLRLQEQRDCVTGSLDGNALVRVGAFLWRACSAVQLPLALAAFDVDYYMRLRSGSGDAAAEAVLMQVAAVLRRIAGQFPGAQLGRYRHDRFAAFLPGADLAAARDFGTMAHAAIAHACIVHAYSPVSERVTLSIGVAAASLPGPGSAGAIMSEAWLQVRASKRAGRNRTSASAATCLSHGAPPAAPLDGTPAHMA